MMTRKTWLLGSTLLLAAACSDDDESSTTRDPATTGDGGTIDGSVRDGSLDASLAVDASADATVDAAADAGVAPEIVGVWHSSFGGELEITASKFGAETIVALDNEARTMISQSPADDQYSPNKFNKQVWTPVTKTGFYQCTQDYGKDTIAEAQASTMKADASKPETGGCGDGDYPWTQFAPAIELRGAWQSNGAAFAVDSDTFGDYAIESYDNDADTAVLSTGGGDAGLQTFSKLVWTVATPTRVYYCLAASGLASADEAAASTATADVSMPTTGCNGAAWTSLTQ